jgi:hypothetical protein
VALFATLGSEPLTCASAAARLAHGAAADVPRAPSSLILGVSANVRSADGRGQCIRYAELQATGVRGIREDLAWGAAEPVPGRPDFGSYDRLVLSAAEHGLTVLPLVDDTPRWAGAGPQALPSDPRQLADFVAAVARRFGRDGELWRGHPSVPAHPVTWIELYNEPYLHAQDPGTYARLVRAVALALRRAGSGAKLVAVSDRSAWLAGMYAAVPDLFGYASAVSLHPYSTEPPDAPPGPETTRGLELIHATMAAHGDGSIPIWITEIGWSTCPASGQCVGDEGTQSEFLARTLELAATRWAGYVRALFVYDLRDADSQPVDDKEAWFGLLRPDGSPKPAWLVLAAATGSLRARRGP